MKTELTIKNRQSRPFSIWARLRSIRCAIKGINDFFSAEHNAVIHLVMTVAVFAAAIFFRVNRTELTAIIVVTAFVWVAELFNTAIERLADIISTRHDPRIKFIKDVSAAAVLIASIAAMLVGLLIFLPKFFA